MVQIVSLQKTIQVLRQLRQISHFHGGGGGGGGGGFNFSAVNEGKVPKYFDRIGLRKANGLHGVSSKIIHLTKPVTIKPITDFVNRMIDECRFLDPMKYAHVSPTFKMKDPIDCQNYRPVSILPTISKLLRGS